MYLIIVEDIGASNLKPITATRPVFDLICGTLTLADRIRRYMPGKKVSYIMRPELHAVYRERNPGVHIGIPREEERVFINGRVLWTEQLSRLIQKLRRAKRNVVVRSKDDWIAVYQYTTVSVDVFDFIRSPVERLAGFGEEEMIADIITYPWHIIEFNAKYVEVDFSYRARRVASKIQGTVHQRAVLENKKNIIIGARSVVGPLSVIDAMGGPVILERDVTIEPHVYITGPVWINSKTVVKAGARVYGGTSIGYNCRAGGEIVSTIMHAYTNKAHEGFLGHSYLGEWINIGADTNNSNLKNDYGHIRVMINGKPVDSGRQFFGTVIGDHSRTGINTMINTGTVIGVGCNIFGANFPAKWIPDFSWGGSDFLRVYQFEKFLQNAVAMMARRGVHLSESETLLLRQLYDARDRK